MWFKTKVMEAYPEEITVIFFYNLFATLISAPVCFFAERNLTAGRSGWERPCRSGLRERPQWVALRGRSGLRFVSSRHGNASDLGASLWQVALRGVSHDRNASDLSMSLWLDRYGMCVTETSRRRSGEVAL
ncbi:hypothetical protein DY000_02060970, partial [Brassica cretica]